MQDLKGRVAVVTGAANGIGRALATELAGEGMRLVLADVEVAPLEDAAAHIVTGGGEAIAVPTDVSDPGAVEQLAERTVAEFGAVHLLCNNAAVAGQFGRVWATSLAEWEWVFAVNVMGVVNGLKSFVPHLLEHDEAHVFTTGSAACFEALPGFGVYASSKHAVLGICEALKRELVAAGASVGVTVGMPAGVVKSSIMTGQRNWLPRFGSTPPADDGPVATQVRQMFDDAVADGVDPSICARAFVDGIKRDLYLVCEDMEQLAEWSAHHAEQGRGATPTWAMT